MQIDSFNSLETQVLSKFNEGFKTHEALKNVIGFNEKTLTQVLENLISRNIFVYNTKLNEYEYTTTSKEEKIILEGNIMLPTTIITFDNRILVSRGKWYEFPLNFDIRRIIWNVQLPNAKRSTLIQLIQESVIREKKSKLIQIEEYKPLVGKIIPYNENISLQINVVSENITDVYILFKIKLYPSTDDKGIFTEYRGFKVRSEIKTEQLINELKKKASEGRNFENIELNRMFNLSSFIFSGNEIPYSYDEESNKKPELEFLMMDGVKKITKIDKIAFDDSTEAVVKLAEHFNMFASKFLIKCDFLIEMTN